MKLCADPETMPTPDGVGEGAQAGAGQDLQAGVPRAAGHHPVLPVRDEALKRIIRLKLGKIQRRLDEKHRIELTYDDAVMDEIASRCTEVESGARNVDNILTNTLLPDISRMLLAGMAAGNKPDAIHVGVGTEGKFVYG